MKTTEVEPYAAFRRLDSALFALLSLPCVSKAAFAAPKITRILLPEMCKAVFTERIFVQARKRTQGILCVLPRTMTRHERKSA